MKIKQALKHAGSKEALADLAKVSVTTVRRWIDLGEIPAKDQALIEVATEGALKAEGITKWRRK